VLMPVYGVGMGDPSGLVLGISVPGSGPFVIESNNLKRPYGALCKVIFLDQF
jgi:hypothetical protein